MADIENKINVVDVDIEKEMKKSYLEYAMSVIVARALPDVRDGLKPVHRRIIYAMQGLGLLPDKPYKKSSRLVGEVMGKYHPHGDSAIYDATVRLAQDFNLRYPLVDGQGNFGTIDGDGAAAPRYTEVRMQKLALEMLKDINKDTVDFSPNYDENEKEPVVLPSKFPNLLVNGAAGIAVGMATNMPPHNLNEVIDATCEYIDNFDISIEELMKFVKGPDFPTGANIMGLEGIKQAYHTGRGKITVRAVANIEEYNNKTRIIVTEIPYQVNKTNLIMKIVELIKDKRIEGISDLRDESNMKGIRIVIELKRDANPNIILNNLYKHTQMQTTFGVINLALVNGEPKVLTLKELIGHYVEHQREVITRRCRFELKKAEDRAHIVEGLLKAIDHIDEIIKIIRASYSDAQEKLMERFGFTKIQAESILEMRLRRLQGLEREKLQDEYNSLIKEIARLKEILGNERLILNIIKEELIEIKEKFGDDRRTEIKPNFDEIEIEELIKEEDVVITLTKQGYIKRIPSDTYKVQNRGGKGVVALTTKEDDYVDSLFVTSTHSLILFFTNKGRVYKLKAYEIPEGKRQAKGQNIINLLELMHGEKVNAVIPVKDAEADEYLIMATKKGTIKRTSVELFKAIRKVGMKAINLVDDDELIQVRVSPVEDSAILVTKKGLAIKFALSDLREIGRTGQGVRGIKLDKDDEVVSMNLDSEGKHLLVFSEYGYGKRTLASNYKVQNRGGKGVKTYKVTEKTGFVVSSKMVNPNDEVIVLSQSGGIIRLLVKDIPVKGRDTQGVIIKDVNKDEDKIVAVAKYVNDVE
ncbi:MULTISPECIES: DNA gyrase subunit A [unclassified Parvimonas]|uniref:DNA gyrase subunit A n=1 Tax=unclassified Parvimonas TaxID=1151464 RepID=UPI002B477A18|nr:MULTISPECIES: DNA gyrase subunit A [unclassified Parvimonas]MEB3025375.1 DNA gyrase subunit A [Parvimonas sp. M13]MEB3089511.1 DNA gyrase subunit A [Parvimonas sp. M20]